MNLVLLGKLVGTHGIKGEVKILSNSDFKAERFKIGNTLYLKKNKEEIPITINSHRVHKGLDLVTFNNYKNINDVEKYIGFNVYVDYTAVEELGEDEYFYIDVIDCEVYNTEDELLGVVADLRKVPQGSLIELKKVDGSKALIPFIGEFVMDVDIEKKKIVIDPIEGLL